MPPPRLPRVLCLHGYRSCAEVMRLQMRPYIEALRAVAELVFVDAPTPSSGPSASSPGAPQIANTIYGR